MTDEVISPEETAAVMGSLEEGLVELTRGAFGHEGGPHPLADWYEERGHGACAAEVRRGWPTDALMMLMRERTGRRALFGAVFRELHPWHPSCRER